MNRRPQLLQGLLLIGVLVCASVFLVLLRVEDSPAPQTGIARLTEAGVDPGPSSPAASEMAGLRDTAKLASQSSVDEQKPRGRHITVRVVNQNGTALQAGTVELLEKRAVVAEGRVNIDGNAVFADIEPGRYKVRLEGLEQGYLPPSRAYYVRSFADRPTTLECVCGIGGSIQIHAAGSWPEGSLEEAEAILQGAGLSTASYKLPLDQSGVTRIENIFPGSYRLTLQLTKGPSLVGHVLPQARKVTIEPGEVTQVTVTMPASGPTLFVTVVDQAGIPLPDVPLRLYAGDNKRTVATGFTGANGTCAFPHCPLEVLTVDTRIDPVKTKAFGTPQALVVPRAPKTGVVDLTNPGKDFHEVELKVHAEPQVARMTFHWAEAPRVEGKPAYPVLYVFNRHLRPDEKEMSGGPRIPVRASPDGRYRVAIRRATRAIHVTTVHEGYELNQDLFVTHGKWVEVQLEAGLGPTSK